MKIPYPKLTIVFTLVIFAVSCLADEWSSWQVMSGSGRLSMRSVQVNKSLCAFAFRNNSTNLTITGAKIHYFHSGRVENDILPEIRPQRELGGWAAFSVEDQCSNVRVEVYDENWE